TSLNCTGACPAGTDPIQAAKVQFPNAYVVNGTFVNGSAGDVSLSLTLEGQPLNVLIHQAIITFDNNRPGAITNGTIGGIIKPDELIASIKTAAGGISLSLCQESVFSTIANVIRQAADSVFDDPSNPATNDAGAPVMCDSISVGFGFEAAEIAIPTAADI